MQRLIQQHDDREFRPVVLLRQHFGDEAQRFFGQPLLAHDQQSRVCSQKSLELGQVSGGDRGEAGIGQHLTQRRAIAAIGRVNYHRQFGGGGNAVDIGGHQAGIGEGLPGGG